jgi:flagellar protein FliO/FliZ
MYKKRSAVCIIVITILLLAIVFSTQSLGAAASKKGQDLKKDTFVVKPYEEPKVAAGPSSFISGVISFFLNVFYYIFVLALALALGYFGVMFGGKLLMYKGMTPQAGNAIRVLETSFLGPNKSLHLIEVAGSVLLIASTQSSINFITEIPDSELISDIKNKRPASPLPAVPFADVISKLSSKISRFSKKDIYRQDMAGTLKDGIDQTIKSLRTNMNKYDQNLDSLKTEPNKPDTKLKNEP